MHLGNDEKALKLYQDVALSLQGGKEE